MRKQVETIDDVDLVSLVGGVHHRRQWTDLAGARARQISAEGQQSMRIELLESGEIIDYPLADILEDRFEV